MCGQCRVRREVRADGSSHADCDSAYRGRGLSAAGWASAAVRSTYRRLKALVMKRFANHPKGELALVEHEAAPQKWEAALAAEPSAAGAAAVNPV
jgi:hypothetical protein